MIIFDNADWYPKCVSKTQKKLNWNCVDFIDFGPLNKNIWQTSIFLNPKLNLRRQKKYTHYGFEKINKKLTKI